jgi:hypothetical protein
MTVPIFLWSLFLNVLGSLIGLGAGVLLTKRQWKRERVEQTKALRVHLIKAFRSVLSGIEQGLGFLQSKPPTIPNYRLDTVTIGHILLNGRDLFPTDKMFDDFNWQRYQLEHINTKLDYLHLYFSTSGGRPTMVAVHEFDSLVAHLKTTQREISEMLSSYESSSES